MKKQGNNGALRDGFSKLERKKNKPKTCILTANAMMQEEIKRNYKERTRDRECYKWNCFIYLFIFFLG